MDSMLWITLVLALLLSLTALAYVILPLVTKQSPLLPAEDDRMSDLLMRKDRTLRAIKELEFDHQVGKISEEDYQRFNQRLSRQAIGLIQQLEKITPESNLLDQHLEAEIAQHRQTQAPVQAQKAAKSITLTAPPVANAGASRFCTQCGVHLDANFKFCGNCGAPVAVAAAVRE
jgi:NADH pyrophosphatase NudC (nudix superfamily)